jgi:D-sedoheptulose 7-phosphate isomerase
MISIENYINQIRNEINLNTTKILQFAKLVKKIKNKKKRIFFIGNGASNTIGSHFALDFSKNLDISSVNLESPALITAISNDLGYEYIFERMLKSFNINKDLLIAISSSGNSKNIINAINFFKNKGHVVTLSGINKNNKAIKTNTKGINIFINLCGYNQVECSHNQVLGFVCDYVKGNHIYKCNT